MTDQKLSIPQAWLNQDQWNAIGKHLSYELDSQRKALILDFIDTFLLFEQLENRSPTPTPARLRGELISFKEIAQKLIPAIETESFDKGIHLNSGLPLDIQEKMASTYLSLTIQAKAFIGDALWLMTRTDTGKHIYHPSQYDIAAKLALERLPKPKRGRGNPLSAEEFFLFKRVFELWEYLGETNTAISYNGQTTDEPVVSPFVAFTHLLFSHCNIQYSLKTVNDYLKKHRIK